MANNNNAGDGLIAGLILVIFFLSVFSVMCVKYYRHKAIQYNVASWTISTGGTKTFVWHEYGMSPRMEVNPVIEKEEE